MNKACKRLLWLCVVALLTMPEMLLAQTPDPVLYGTDVTLNGNGTYTSPKVVVGDTVHTGGAPAKLLYEGAEMELAPNTTAVIGNPIQLTCGTITVHSGAFSVNDGTKTMTVASGQSDSGTEACPAAALPDAPSASAQASLQQEAEPPAPGKHHRGIQGVPAAGRSVGLEGPSADWSYVAVNSVMFASSIVAAEKTVSCMNSGACSFVPDSLRSRGALYGAGLPVGAGVAYLGYYLKSKGHRWWFIPAAVVTVGDVIVAAHATRYSR